MPPACRSPAAHVPVAKSSPIWPHFDQGLDQMLLPIGRCWPNVTKLRPDMAQTRPMLLKAGPMWPNLGKIWPDSANIGKRLRFPRPICSKAYQLWSNHGQMWSNMAKSGPTLANCEVLQTSADFVKIGRLGVCPNSSTCCLNSAEVGHVCPNFGPGRVHNIVNRWSTLGRIFRHNICAPEWPPSG